MTHPLTANSTPNSATPDPHRPVYEFVKRAFDLALATAGLILCSPLMLIIALVIKADSPGPIFYRGLRVGRFGVPFHMMKFRTMVADAEQRGGSCTGDNDQRITRAGATLRKTKLDELPQLFNVVAGTMSFVGPRPEVEKFTDLFTAEERHILDVKPGITDWATLWNPDEGAVLAGAMDPEHAYMGLIRPTKIALQLEYFRSRSFLTDMVIVSRTIWLVLRRVLSYRNRAQVNR